MPLVAAVNSRIIHIPDMNVPYIVEAQTYLQAIHATAYADLQGLGFRYELLDSMIGALQREAQIIEKVFTGAQVWESGDLEAWSTRLFHIMELNQLYRQETIAWGFERLAACAVYMHPFYVQQYGIMTVPWWD
jgi:hypothetical protein